MIKIEIPATSANLGSGFDSLGVALDLYNHVWMEEADDIEITSKDDADIPKDESNLIYWSADRLYKECGKVLPGLRIIQENRCFVIRRCSERAAGAIIHGSKRIRTMGSGRICAIAVIHAGT